MSRTFSMKSGSAGSLNVSVRCGCSARARQMRCTELRSSPLAVAIDRVLQCVASAGVVSSVRVSTRSTGASASAERRAGAHPGVRRAAGSGSACATCRRSAGARGRCSLCLGHPRMRRARWATACAVFPRRAQRSSVSRSVDVKVDGGIGRPVRIGVLPPISRTRGTHKLLHGLPRQDPSRATHRCGRPCWPRPGGCTRSGPWWAPQTAGAYSGSVDQPTQDARV
jgi:hypothetical protein